MIAKLTRAMLALSLLCCIAASLAGWIIPVEAVQNWAFSRVPADDVYRQFEAVGRAEAVWWLFSYGGPALSIVALWAWRRRRRVAEAAQRLTAELHPLPIDSPAKSWMGASARWIKAASLAATILLAGVHLAGGVWDRVKDWPYYRLHSGDEILPNISESNRDVIRYLRSSTPEDSRIFVVSDQKLFFLSYYLYPRQVLHRIHPDAEHIIPRAHQARQLAAYRLSDLPPVVLRDNRPDYVLEYFEGPDYVMPERNAEDGAWLVSVRQQRQDAAYVPPYTVVLRPYEEVAAP